MHNQLKRVVIVTETYAPEVNGVANTLRHLVTGILDKNIAVQIVKPKQKAQESGHAHAYLESVSVAGLPIPGYKALQFGLPCRRKLQKLWETQKPDVIYIATEGPLGLAASKAALKLNIPVLSGFHTNFHSYIKHYKLAWATSLVYGYMRHFHNGTSGTLVPTQAMLDDLTTHGFENVQVLSRGVDSHLFSPQKRCKLLRASWGLEENDVALMYVGRIAAEKNIELALQTYHKLKARHKTLKFVIVGDGPLAKKIAQDNNDIILCGMQTGAALAKHYASGDIFLFPSKTDTFGNVVTEAMASGLAVISFNYAAGQTHIAHKQNGMLARLDSDEEFIEATSYLLESNTRLKEICHNARKHAISISWKAIVDDFIKKLIKITNREANDNNDSRKSHYTVPQS